MKKLLIMALAIVMAGCGAGSGSENTGGEVGNGIVPDEITPIDSLLTVQASISGKSRLHIMGNTVWWEHINHIAPGARSTPYRPTFVDGKAWTPLYPDSGHNAFCLCDSDIFTFTSAPIREDIAIKFTQSQSSIISILQQPSDVLNDEIIIQFNNTSQFLDTITIHLMSLDEPGDAQITSKTAVNDLENPQIDEVSLAQYKRDWREGVTAPTVIVNFPSDDGLFIPRNSVGKGAWTEAFSELFPPEVCKPDVGLLACYDMYQSECLKVAQAETNTCLNQYMNDIPSVLNQPNDGSAWGRTIGGCAGDGMDTYLADRKTNNCPG